MSSETSTQDQQQQQGEQPQSGYSFDSLLSSATQFFRGSSSQDMDGSENGEVTIFMNRIANLVGYTGEEEEGCPKLQCALSFANPMENYYAQRYFFAGRPLDKFGYMAHSLTLWKEENVFPYGLMVRGPVILFGSLLTFRFSRGIFNRTVYPLSFYFLGSAAIAPEMVNPYYTLYSLNRRFGNEEGKDRFFKNYIVRSIRCAYNSTAAGASQLYESVTAPTVVSESEPVQQEQEQQTPQEKEVQQESQQHKSSRKQQYR